MGKNKFKRFQECATFECLVQPAFDEVFRTNYKLKGKWHKEFFKNDNPIILELGCGRGEYTIGLAQMYPDKNFIGIDIKGARIWRGAKTATDDNMNNVGYIRTRIEFILAFFGKNEISEIWITFPDPQLKKNRAFKRLTAPDFLSLYAEFLTPDGFINLKTDSQFLHNYTVSVANSNKLNIVECCNDIYNVEKEFAQELRTIQTTYEAMFLKQDMPITYVKFGLGGKNIFTHDVEDEDISSDKL